MDLLRICAKNKPYRIVVLLHGVRESGGKIQGADKQHATTKIVAIDPSRCIIMDHYRIDSSYTSSPELL